VFAFPNVFDFFAHELASLSAGRLAFALVLVRPFNCFFFWHNKMVSPLDAHLDVNKKAARLTSRRSFGSGKTSLIVRLADRRPVDRHLVFHARAAVVHAPVCRVANAFCGLFKTLLTIFERFD